MGKRISFTSVILLILCFSITGCANDKQEEANTKSVKQASDSDIENQGVSTVSDSKEGLNPVSNSVKTEYKDGIYEGESQITIESYYGKAKVEIKDGKITDVDFKIYDKARNDRLLDKSYGEEVFASEPLYQEQTTNDLAGIEIYESGLISGQELSKVDTISGATWSFNLFNEALDNTLKKALK